VLKKNSVRWTLIAALSVAASMSSAAATPPTVDKIYSSTWDHGRIHFQPGATQGYDQFHLSLALDDYELSDGTTWESGAGGYSNLYAAGPTSIEVHGDSIAYRFAQPANGELLYHYTSFMFGDQVAGGNIGTPSDLVVTAKLGGTTATISGYVKVLANDPLWFGDRFRYYSAPVGSSVFFQQTYTLSDTVFDRELFQRAFWYSGSGVIDFTQVASAVPEPRTYALFLGGLLVVVATVRRSRDGKA